MTGFTFIPPKSFFSSSASASMVLPLLIKKKMTDAILGAVVEKSISLIENEFATLSGLRKKTEKLRSTLTLISAVLEDAEERQMKDRAVKAWLQQLRDAAHVLDDILENCSSESLQHGGLSSFNLKNIMFRREVGHRLKEMMERLDQIAKAKNDFGLREGVSNRERPSEVAEWRQTTHNIAIPQVYGREEDKEKVVKFLLSPDQGSDSVSVYAIIGLGGLGKTTLSQLVYNDHKVSSHFNLKIWVCVSENFTKKQILRSIIESVKETCDISNLDVMEGKVQELLHGKRYLLVLDDVWKKSQDMEFGLSEDEWDKLRFVLSCGSKGSSILVSSRDMDVATIMRACQTHKLSGLTDEDCWSLFKHRAFRIDREEYPELVKIGKEIVKKCGGSPLAAQALGGVMRTRSGEKQWLDVLKSELWTLSEENGILPALRLSYFHLTPTSKKCFAFCAIFPKDKEIWKEDLIHLWMANGFISSRENLDVEEVGNMVWNELYQKSFFQDVTTDDFGDISFFKMHDLVHDLAQSITEKECVFLEEKNLEDLPRNTHHIGSGYGAKTTFNYEGFEKFESLRTLYGKPDFLEAQISIRFPNSIRVLCTNSLEPLFPGNLTHLRYLQLSCLNIETLPNSIYNLCKLEVLKLIRLWDLHCLPKHLTRLKNLRHLVIEECWSLSHMFPNIHKLSHLRTLSVYIVKTETGHSLAELRDLNLGGVLTIKDLGNVGTISEVRDANLKGKGDLRKLSLSWDKSDETNSDAPDAGHVLEALQPHPNLKSLEIIKYKGLHWPSWMGNNSSIFDNLVSLYLRICDNCVQLPPLGKLPYLKTLHLSGMKYVQYVEGGESYDDGVEMRAFPSLEELKVWELPNLERLLKMETRDDMFPCLSSLQVLYCPKLQLSFPPCVKDLLVYGCNNELLKSISFLNTLHSLSLQHSEDITSFPEGMMNNLTTSLKHLTISNFKKLKELPCEITKLNALESLLIKTCDELESFPEQGMEDLRSLRSLEISWCRGLRCLPDGLRHLTSLEALTIRKCPTLKKRCEEGTGEDWPKIAHIPMITVW